MARESWPLGTRTVAVRVTRSIVTFSTFAGPRAAATKAPASSDHGTMSMCSLDNSLRIARCLTPLGPTHAPTGSSPGSLDETAILVRRPGSRAMARTCTVPALISGTSASSRRWTKVRAARETRTWACLRLCWVSRITTGPGLRVELHADVPFRVEGALVGDRQRPLDRVQHLVDGNAQLGTERAQRLRERLRGRLRLRPRACPRQRLPMQGG